VGNMAKTRAKIAKNNANKSPFKEAMDYIDKLYK